MEIPEKDCEPRPPSEALRRRLKQALAVLLLLAVLLAVYWPALRGDFLWDDDDHISRNKTLPTLAGLWDIWTAPGIAMQYYPLTFTGFWIAYHLWGLNPLGFHLLTLFFHGMASLLLWQVLKRLQVRGAWLAGAIFALHPVNVMSVAWMTELKNTLSGTLVLAAAWAYVRFAGLGVYRRTAPDSTEEVSARNVRYGVLSLLLFQMAMFAKTAVSFLPASLLLVLWWQRGRVRWRQAWPLLVMLVIAVGMGMMTFHIEHRYGARGDAFQIGFLDRLLVSGRSFWFYLEKLFFPYELTFIYERWKIDAGAWWQYLYPAATLGMLGGLWLLRKRIGKGPLVAMLHFYITTSMLVLIQVLYMMSYSWVTDHWQYFGCMSVIALVAAGITAGLGRFEHRRPFLQPALCGALLLVLGTLSWRQAWVYRSVETLWTDTLQKNPNCWLACNNLGIALLQKGNMDEAIAHFQKTLQIKPDYAEAHYNLGNALLEKGKVDEAIAHFQKALQIKPDFAVAHYNFGDALLEKGKVDEAIAHYQKALEIDPDYAGAYINLGNALLEKGKVDEAIAHFQKALQIKPDFALAHYNLGDALIRKGSVNEAIVHYQKALEIDPDYAGAHINLGNALLQNGKVDEAIAHFQKALQINPDSAEAHYNLGNALLQKGSVGEAISHYQRALQITPDFAEAHNNLGNTLLQKGNLDEAIAHFQKALQIKPGFAEAHNNLGNALLRKGNLDEAMAHFQKALQIKPDFAEAHYNFGNVLLQKGKVDEAIAHFQKALQINPDSAEAHYNLGNALLQKGSVDEAMAHYQKALQINPDYAEAHNNLGGALLQKGKVDEAIAHFQKALQINPGYAGAHYNLGNALLQKGKVDEAIAHYQKALQITPDYAKAQKNLAWVLATCPQASLRNGNRAVELAQRANQLTGDGNPAVLGTLAAAYAEAGRFPEAVATAQRALQLAGTQSNPALADALRSQLKLYQAGLPFHQH